ANFLQIHDMGVRISNDNFSAVISSLIEHKERLRRMRENCRSFDKSHANENIVALAEKLAKSYVGYNPAVRFETYKGDFRLRTAAVILHEGRVLLAKDTLPAYYLPGGGVTMHETAENALLRELSEELGIEAAIRRPLWITERFYRNPADDHRMHELCTYFAVDISGTDLLSRGDRFACRDAEEVFEWVPLETLPEQNLVPAFLKTDLQNLPDTVQFLTFTK
ncbi:MAG: NUDIX domain-containing protein, partial [Clostridia bacterium]|nr:NUDIX domain-containing protein [Clostridia bacterium]